MNKFLLFVVPKKIGCAWEEGLVLTSLHPLIGRNTDLNLLFHSEEAQNLEGENKNRKKLFIFIKKDTTQKQNILSDNVKFYYFTPIFLK